MINADANSAAVGAEEMTAWIAHTSFVSAPAMVIRRIHRERIGPENREHLLRIEFYALPVKINARGNIIINSLARDCYYAHFSDNFTGQHLKEDPRTVLP